MSEKLDKLRATLKKEQERRIKLNNRIAVLERRIQEEEAAEVSSMVRTANVTPEQLAALLRQVLPPGWYRPHRRKQEQPCRCTAQPTATVRQIS